MEQLITDRLRENLTRLNLIRASEVLQTIAEQAETATTSRSPGRTCATCSTCT